MHKAMLRRQRAALLMGVAVALVVLPGCGSKEEPQAKGYYEGTTTNKGSSSGKPGAQAPAPPANPSPQ